MANPLEENPDWRQGYGFQFWLARHGYRGDGAYGQFCVVLPEQQTVVAITGASLDMQAVLDGLWSHLLPALGDDHRSSPDKTAADLRLARRMTSLALPPATGEPEPTGDPAAADGVVLTPEGGRCTQQPSLTSVELHRTAEGWQITLGEGDRGLGGTLGTPGWRVSDEPGPDGIGRGPDRAQWWLGGRSAHGRGAVPGDTAPADGQLRPGRRDVHGDLGHGAAQGRHAARSAQAGLSRPARSAALSRRGTDRGKTQLGRREASSAVDSVSTASSTASRPSIRRSIRRSRTATSCSRSSPARSTAATRNTRPARRTPGAGR